MGAEGTEDGVLSGGGRGDFGAVLHLSALLLRHLAGTVQASLADRTGAPRGASQEGLVRPRGLPR